MTSLLTGHVTDALLRDGRTATIRPATEQDRAALVELFEHASDENLRFRFFSINRHAGEQYVDHLFTSDPASRLVLVGEVDGQVIGLGTAEVSTPTSAEISFLVGDSAHGIGLGTLLLEHLAAEARDRGIGSFTAEILIDNHLMLAVMRDAGFDVVRHSSAGVTSLEMSTTATARAIEAARDRQCRCERKEISHA